MCTVQPPGTLVPCFVQKCTWSDNFEKKRESSFQLFVVACHQHFCSQRLRLPLVDLQSNVTITFARSIVRQLPASLDPTKWRVHFVALIKCSRKREVVKSVDFHQESNFDLILIKLRSLSVNCGFTLFYVNKYIHLLQWAPGEWQSAFCVYCSNKDSTCTAESNGNKWQTKLAAGEWTHKPERLLPLLRLPMNLAACDVYVSLTSFDPASFSFSPEWPFQIDLLIGYNYFTDEEVLQICRDTKCQLKLLLTTQIGQVFK